MNMKNTVILLIFLLSILGLIIGVYYSEDVSGDNAPQNNGGRVYEDNGGIMTITLAENGTNESNLNKFFT